MIRLQKAREKDRELLWNINQKYLYEMTNFYDDPMDENGNYHYGHFDEYFTDPKRTAYFIYNDDTLVGFSFLCPYSNIGQTPDYTMAEFTIFPAFRRKQFAFTAAKLILDNHPGKWEIKYNEKNAGGRMLWNTLAAPYEPETHHLNEEETVLAFTVGGIKRRSRMIDISKLSSCYEVRRMDDSDADEILGLCEKNTQYYKYCEAKSTREHVINDLHIAPPGIELKEKYYIGFYQNKMLIAVMDLIDGYPDPDIAFIGFFMMNMAFQGQGIGSSIIQEVASYLKMSGKTAIRLAIDKGNPQSTHFWKKNGFLVIREVDRNGWTALVAERKL